MAFLHEQAVAFPIAVLAGLLTGLVCGLFNGFWIAHVGLPSLVVTLATLIAYRGLALVLVRGPLHRQLPRMVRRAGTEAADRPAFRSPCFFSSLARRWLS